MPADTRMPRTLRVRVIRVSEVQLLTVSRSGAVCRANVGLDLLAGVAVDVLPVVDRFLEYFAADPAEKLTSHVGDELGPLRVVPDLAHQGVGLTEVVILRVQFVGRAHHWTVGLPAVLHRTGDVGEGAAGRVGRIDRLAAGVGLSLIHISEPTRPY